MTEPHACPHRPYAAAPVSGVDCPICFHDQRSKMQSADYEYLHTLSSECIKGRRGPPRMYNRYARGVARADLSQAADWQYFSQYTTPPLRKAEFESRLSSYGDVAAQRVKPLQPAEAISLQPVAPSPPPPPAGQNDEDPDVFFDEPRMPDAGYVLLNGEVHHVLQGMQYGRVLHGIDSPVAAIHTAVMNAARQSRAHRASPSQINESENLQAQSSEVKGATQSNHSATGASNKHDDDSFSAGNCREYLSSSGRRYRVIELAPRLPPIGKENMQSSSPAPNARTSDSASQDDQEGEEEEEEEEEEEDAQPTSSDLQRETSETSHDTATSPSKRKGKKALTPRKPKETGGGRRRVGKPKQEGADSSQTPPASSEARRRRRRGKNGSLSPRGSLQSPGFQSLSFGDSPGADGDGGAARTSNQYGTERRKPKQKKAKRDLLPRIGKGDDGNDTSAQDLADNRPDARAGQRRTKGKAKRRQGKRDDPHGGSSVSDDSDFSYQDSPAADSAGLLPDGGAGSDSDASDCVVTEKPQNAKGAAHKRRGKVVNRKHNDAPSSSLSTSAMDHKHGTKKFVDDSDGSQNDSDAEVGEKQDEEENASDARSSRSSSGSQNSSPSQTGTSRWSPLSTEGGGRHRRRGHRGRNGDSRRCSSLTSSEDEEDRRRRRERGRHGRRRFGKDNRHTRKRGTRRSSSSSSLSRSNSTSLPMGRKNRDHHGRPHDLSSSPPQPPVVHAVSPTPLTDVLPPLAEEILPSTRYDDAGMSPIAPPRQHSPAPLVSPLSTALAALEELSSAPSCCASPAVMAPRAGFELAVPENPMRRPLEQLPAGPLQAAGFRDLRTPSIMSSGPVCTTPQGPPQLDSHFPHDLLFDLSAAPASTAAGKPLDLDFITEHVIRVIRARLKGPGGDYADGMEGRAYAQQQQQQEREREEAERRSKEAQEAAAAAAVAAAAEAEQLRRQQEEERIAKEAEHREAMLQRLRELLREAQDESRLAKDGNVPLDSLANSLRFTLAQVERYNEEDWLELDGESDGDAGDGRRDSRSFGTLKTHVYADGLSALPRLSNKAATAGMSDLETDAAELERLLAELRQRRTAHEARAREEAAEAAQKAEKKAAEEAEHRRRRTEVEAAEAAEAAARAQLEQQARDAAAAEAARQRRQTEELEMEAARARQEQEEQRIKAEQEAERQRKAAEKEAAAAAEAAAQEEEARREREQQHRRDLDALTAEEAAARTSIRATEKAARDAMLIHAAKEENHAQQRARSAQAGQFEDEQADLFEEELNERADIAASEADEAEDFWDIAAQLWQAAEDDAQEEEERRAAAAAEEQAEGRRMSAAWQAAQSEEADRMQAEVRRMEADAVAARLRREREEAAEADASAKKRRSRMASKGKLRRSNLIPGQIVNVSDGDGKIRLVGDPHVEAVEARARERRRAEQQRLQRMAAALPPSAAGARGGKHSGASVDRNQLLSQQPSTVRTTVGVNGHRRSGKKSTGASSHVSRASSRQSTPSTGYRFPSPEGGGARVGTGANKNKNGEVSPRSGRNRLQSRTNFVDDGGLDLGVAGHHVGTPTRSRSRASSLASGGVPLMGGIYNAPTPHKSQLDLEDLDDVEDMEDGLTSVTAANADY